MSERPIEELVAELRGLIAGAIEDEETGHEDSDALANLGLTMQHEGERLLDELDALRADAATLRAAVIAECIAALPKPENSPMTGQPDAWTRCASIAAHQLRALLAPPVRDEGGKS